MGKKKVGRFVYNKDDILGTGQYGKVYLAEDTANNEKVAVKIIDKQKINEDQYTKDALIREIQIMKALKSPNIIQFLDVHETKNNIYIFQEIASDGSLKQYMAKAHHLDEDKARYFISQLIFGFSQLAKNGIIHRDVKPDNILMKGETLKLADFGFARHSQNMCFLNSIVGSPAYMAPQVLNREKFQNYSYKCDIWSLGVIFYEMVVGRLPWELKAKTLQQLYFEVEKQSKIGVKFGADINISDELKNLIEGCLKFEEEERFDWIKIFNHPAITNTIKQMKITDQFSIKEAFALTKLRMTIHAKNIKLSKIFKTISDDLDFDKFYLLFQPIDPFLTKNQIECIFKGIAQGAQTVSHQDIIHSFTKHGFHVEGCKLSHLLKNSQCSHEIDKKIEEITLIIEQEKINLEELFNKYDKEGRKKLNPDQFGGMLRDICPSLNNQQIKEIFQLFKDLDSHSQEVSQESCFRRFYKLAMMPNLNNMSIKESMSKLSKKSL